MHETQDVRSLFCGLKYHKSSNKDKYYSPAPWRIILNHPPPIIRIQKVRSNMTLFVIFNAQLSLDEEVCSRCIVKLILEYDCGTSIIGIQKPTSVIGFSRLN